MQVDYILHSSQRDVDRTHSRAGYRSANLLLYFLQFPTQRSETLNDYYHINQEYVGILFGRPCNSAMLVASGEVSEPSLKPPFPLFAETPVTNGISSDFYSVLN